MARPIWKGHISFGLINIPVTLYSAEKRSDLNFHLIDSRNKAKVRYERINEATGEEVPWNRVVKGYEFDDKENYVLLGEEDFKKADIKATQTVELKDFVTAEEMNCMYFDKPYYLIPDKKAEKGYVLLRETLKRTKTIGIARVVIRTREYIAALLATGQALVLNLLRYHQEIRKETDFDLPSEDIKKLHVSPREIEMAEKFVEMMTTSWKPEKYKDRYRERLIAWIEKKARTGKTKVIEEEKEAPEPEVSTEAVDMIALLRKSLEQSGNGRKRKRHEATA
ncbi:MAG: non-homologous end joining protein Ku [Thermodesulfobacteriota bacterium]